MSHQLGFHENLCILGSSRNYWFSEKWDISKYSCPPNRVTLEPFPLPFLEVKLPSQKVNKNTSVFVESLGLRVWVVPTHAILRVEVKFCHPHPHQQEQQENHVRWTSLKFLSPNLEKMPLSLEVPSHHILGKETCEVTTTFEAPKHLVERSTRVVPDQPPMTTGGCLAESSS